MRTAEWLLTVSFLITSAACGAPAATGGAPAAPEPEPTPARGSERSRPTAGVPDLVLPDADAHATARRGLQRRADLARPSERAQLVERIALDHLEEAEEAERAALTVEEWEARAGRTPEGEALQARLTAQAQAGREEAIRLIEQLLREHPDDAAAPGALYTLASALQVAGRGADALPVLRRLIGDWPDSEFVPDALLDLGDAAFDRGDLLDARRLYEQVLTREQPDPQSDLRPYARYKLAWTLWNLHDVPAALEHLRALARLAPVEESPLVRLVRAARQDYAALYAQAGPVDRAAEHFRELAPEHATAMLERLALACTDLGKFADARRVWGDLLGATTPCDPARLRFHAARLRAALVMGDEEGLLSDADAWTADAQRLPACLGQTSRSEYDRERSRGLAELRAVADQWRAELPKAGPVRGERLAHLEALLEAVEPSPATTP